MKIGNHEIGPGNPTFVIGEVGLAHDGSVRIAHEFIDAIADAGADACKFQDHFGDLVDTWRIDPKGQRARWETRHEYWKRTGFGLNDWKWLKSHAEGRGLVFLCSPFSLEAVKRLDPLVPAWKIPSGCVGDWEMLQAIAATGKPVLLSTGMGEAGTSWFGQYIVMHCRSLYPCPPERLDFDHWFQERPRGFSDHSGTIYAGLAAVTLGCDVLEVHVKLSGHDQGPDSSSSITPSQLKQLVEGIRFIEKAKMPVDKDELERELEPMRQIFMRQPA